MGKPDIAAKYTVFRPDQADWPLPPIPEGQTPTWTYRVHAGEASVTGVTFGTKARAEASAKALAAQVRSTNAAAFRIRPGNPEEYLPTIGA